ncbi:MAG TPA: hypothetical protein H9858_03695 [Candidatus Blautia stercoravium]|nr:hypothetical protein [Candidatus Blautia stercoravium]
MIKPKVLLLDEFQKITREKLADNHAIAIDPETIFISREKKNQEKTCEFNGTVLESHSTGNELRYALNCGHLWIFVKCSDVEQINFIVGGPVGSSETVLKHVDSLNRAYHELKSWTNPAWMRDIL